MLVKTMSIHTSTSPSMAHIPMKPTKWGSSFSKMDVNGAMLRAITPFGKFHYILPSPWQPLECNHFPLFDLHPLYVKSRGVLNFTINMTSKLLPTTSFEKWHQEMIHFEVEILPSWQAIVVKLSNFPTRHTIDQTSMTLGLVLVCNKEDVFNSRGMDMGKHLAFWKF